MIAACPKCQTRYRLRLEQLGERGVRLRCRRCESLFRVLPPPQEAPPADAASAPELRAPAPAPVAAPAPTREVDSDSAAGAAPTQTPGSAAAGEGLATPPEVPTVLVAHRDARAAKRLADLFGGSGARTLACDDGAQTLLALHRTPPRVAVLDAGLAGVDGHQICEIMKRNEALSGVGVVLLRAADGDSADPAAAGFGADLYLDPAECVDGLPARLHEPLASWGVTLLQSADPALLPEQRPEPPTPSAVAEPPAPPSPAVAEPPAPIPPVVAEPVALTPPAVAEPVAPTPPVVAEPPVPAAPPADDEELARAERLARIAVSDIVLYNEEKFAAALRSGDPLQAMRDEVEEGRALLRGRIDSAVFEQRDFVGEELMRVAGERA